MDVVSGWVLATPPKTTTPPSFTYTIFGEETSDITQSASICSTWPGLGSYNSNNCGCIHEETWCGFCY